jgi:hypothetical protein
MLCELTRPYPALTPATTPTMVARSRVPFPAQPHVPNGISQIFRALPTEFRGPEFVGVLGLFPAEYGVDGALVRQPTEHQGCVGAAESE